MILDELKQYAHDCISGKNISGRKHIWACERLLKDIDRIGQSDFPYIWNEKQAENIVEWFALLRHSKGILAKQPIILTPWQNSEFVSYMDGCIKTLDTGDLRNILLR